MEFNILLHWKCWQHWHVVVGCFYDGCDDYDVDDWSFCFPEVVLRQSLRRLRIVDVWHGVFVGARTVECVEGIAIGHLQRPWRWHRWMG